MRQRIRKNTSAKDHRKTADAAHIKYDLERFLLGGRFDLYEDERLLATLARENCAAEIAYNKLVFSGWGEGWSRSWRVLSCAITDETARLHCTRQMGLTPCEIILRRGAASDSSPLSRREFAHQIGALIAANLAGWHIEQTIQSRDDYRHLSGLHTRLIIKERGHTIAAVAIGRGAAQNHIDATLGAGLVWREELRGRGRKVRRLALFVPLGSALTTACRLTCLTMNNAPIALYEVDETNKCIKPVAAFAQADLSDNLKRASRRAEWPDTLAPASEAARLLDELQALLPETLDTQQRNGWLYLAIRGLTFARLAVQKATLEFGLSPPRQKLNDKNHGELLELLSQITHRRRADRENRGDELFRLHGERWLESIIRRDVTRLDPTLEARFVYSQVPAYRGEQRSFIDLLTVTRQGQLVVMELKVSEDAEFPFQGLDYWIRINWHRLRDDFARRGYFKGLPLTDAPPLLYLVAPLFRFHATTKLIASQISSRVPVYRVGLNDDWRTELRVLLHERLN
ncbi:MAG: hypothetical protein HY231_24695 [Acidobacteria bacterium]|nr:hypothetical protein [Acidobacteriota bacterium]